MSYGNRLFITLTCVFTGTSISLTVMIWFGQTALWIVTVVICGFLTACLLASAFLEIRTQTNNVCGVITVQEVVARQGDGQNYPESFKDQLHAGTEFDLLERQPGWLHIRLSDNSDGWIPDNSADFI